MKVKHYLLLAIGSLIILLLVPFNSWAKQENAPGQLQKQENSSKKAIIGTVENVTGDTVVVKEKQSNKKTEVKIDNTIKLIGQDKKELKLGAIKLKNVIALVSTDSATATSEGKLKIKKIYIKEATASALQKRKAVMGVIVDIAGNTLTLAHQIHRDRTFTVIFGPDTVIKSKTTTNTEDGQATESATEATESAVSNASFEIGMRVAAVGDLTEAGAIMAKRIHIIPGKAVGVFKKQPLATPSASFVATPSGLATPSALPSLIPSPSLIATPTPGF